MSLEIEIREAFERHSADATPAGDMWTGIERRIRRSHRTRMILSGAGAAMAIAAIAFAVPRLVADTVEPILPRPVPASTPVITATIPVGEFGLAAGEDAVWAIQRDLSGGTLVRIATRTNKVVARIALGLAPLSVAVGEDAVWVTNSRGCSSFVSCDPEASPLPEPFPEQNSLMRIDPRTNRVVATVRMKDPIDVATGFDAVWVTAAEETGTGIALVRVDPRSNLVSARVSLGESGVLAFVATGEGSVWVTTVPESNGGAARTRVHRIDPSTNTIVETIEVAGMDGPAALAVGEGAVWVAVLGPVGPSAIARIDPRTNRVTATVVLPEAPPDGLQDVTTAEGYVWATSRRGYLWRVDPRVLAPFGDPLLIGGMPATTVVFGSGSLWVGSGDGNIRRIAP
ncbi:MAG: hypothetical protein WEB06_08650 [Actinomycetota bacterium]